MLITTLHKFDQYWSICIFLILPILLTSSNFGQYPLKSEETMFRTFSWLVIFVPVTDTVFIVLFSVAHIMLP